jgi:hypothetical protein
VRRLEEDVDRALALRETDPELWRATGGLPGAKDEAARVVPERQIGAHPGPAGETSRICVTAPSDVARLFRAVLCTVQRRLERHLERVPTPGEALEAMLDHAFESWAPRDAKVPAEHRVFERDGWRCTAPACSSRRNLHDHHIVFRSTGGGEELGNRTSLCAWHHLRGVHAGVVRCTGTAPDGLRFELGVRPDGPPLARYRSGDVRDVEEAAM